MECEIKVSKALIYLLGSKPSGWYDFDGAETDLYQ